MKKESALLGHDLTDLVLSAAQIADEAGKIVAHGLGDHPEAVSKGRYDIQVDADLAAEEQIVSRLRLLVPEIEIISEEMTNPPKWDGEGQWVVDPLDGTNNYYCGVPYVVVSIALRLHGRLTLAAVQDPILRCSYRAIAGRGALKDGRPMVTAARNARTRATVSLVTNYSSAGRHIGESLYLRLNSGVRRVLTMWAPAADLIRIATGHIDGMVCTAARYGDVCAGLLILAESGGVVIDFAGSDVDVTTIDPRLPVSFVAASSRGLAGELAELAMDIAVGA